MTDNSVEYFLELINKEMPVETKNELAKVSEEDLISLHHGLGRFIRNKYKFWQIDIVKGNPPVSIHPDEASQYIITEIWKTLDKEGNI